MGGLLALAGPAAAVPTPVVGSVTPNSGGLAGGNSITIRGGNFAAGSTSIVVGGRGASGVSCVPSQCIAIVPPGAAAGTVDVRAVVAGVPSALNANDRYAYYSGPVITSLSSNIGPAGGGTITINGYIPGSPYIKFGSVYVCSGSCGSPYSCTVTVPPGAAGTVDVTLIVDGAP